MTYDFSNVTAEDGIVTPESLGRPVSDEESARNQYISHLREHKIQEEILNNERITKEINDSIIYLSHRSRPVFEKWKDYLYEDGIMDFPLKEKWNQNSLDEIKADVDLVRSTM
jgi:hypothetical protein